MKLLAATAIAFALGFGAAGAEVANPLKDEGSWSEIRGDIVENPGAIEMAGDAVEIEAPERAHDAAVVPVRITAGNGAPRITGLTLVVDENPAPMAGRFEFGPSMGPLDFETRLRVAQYSNLRAIATTEDGRTLMTGRFVKASGGCSAPAMKDPETARRTQGQMKVKTFESENGRAEAQVMLRHPNYSGLQRDQITHLFVPANFITDMEVYQGGELLFRMEGGISISENPTFRFKYDDDGSASIRVKATDTEGNVYTREFSKAML